MYASLVLALLLGTVPWDSRPEVRCGLRAVQSAAADATDHPRLGTAARDTGEASMTVRSLVDGQPVPARVRILDASGQVQTEAASGAAISLRTGTYRIEVQVSDPAALADTPKQLREVFLQAGKNTEVEASFPWARVTLNVLVGGGSRSGVPVKLLRNGAVVAQLTSNAKPAAITPGKYEADVLLKGTTIRVKGLMFLEGATQTIPVRVHP